MFGSMYTFLRRQKKNYVVMICRDFTVLASGRRPQISSQLGNYESLFLRRLGASPLEIGIANSLISLTSTVFSYPAGWLTDRVSNIKRSFVLSSGLGLLNYLALAFAGNWITFVIISVWRTAADWLSTLSKTILDVDSLSNRERVQGLSIHRTITAIGGVIGPLVTAFIVTYYGGLSHAESYRPLFLFQFLVALIALALSWKLLDNVTIGRGADRAGVLGAFRSLFQGSAALKVLFIRDVVQGFFASMSRPFLGIYQVDVKMATAFILGYMGAGEMIVDVFLSIPIGRAISKYGRKRVAYAGHLIGLLGRSVLFLTPTSYPEALILYSVLGSIEGCMYLGWDAFAMETVPQEVRGKYLGIRTMTIGAIGIATPVLGGMIWSLNPDYLWWIDALQWALIALPLLVYSMEKYS